MLDFDGKLVRAVPWWERAPARNTIVRLRNRKVPYVQELKVDGESCVRLTAAGRAHYEDHLDRYRAAYPQVRVPGPDSPEALHRGDPGQLHADAEHRRQLYALSKTEVQARIADNEAGVCLPVQRAGDLRKSPSVASLYRALAEAEQAAADDGLPIRPRPVRIRRPDDPLTPEEADLRERVQAQVLQRSEDE